MIKPIHWHFHSQNDTVRHSCEINQSLSMKFLRTYSGTFLQTAPDTLKYILKLHMSSPELQSIKTNIFFAFHCKHSYFILVSTNKKTTYHNHNQLRKKNFAPVTCKTICHEKVLLEIFCLVRKKLKYYSNNKAMAMKDGGSLALKTYYGLTPQSPS